MYIEGSLKFCFTLLQLLLNKDKAGFLKKMIRKFLKMYLLGSKFQCGAKYEVLNQKFGDSLNN